jgi:poly(3-hydroxybutyrate) depolymerase
VALRNRDCLFDITQLSAIADSDGVAMVFPDGQSGSPWNVSDNGAAICGLGAAVNNANAIDFAFMDAMMADGGNGQCYLYDGCPADGQVELCTFTGMGHCWAGGSQSGQSSSFACPTYANATQLEWAFWKKYAW